jgi:hypothetical protein
MRRSRYREAPCKESDPALAINSLTVKFGVSRNDDASMASASPEKSNQTYGTVDLTGPPQRPASVLRQWCYINSKRASGTGGRTEKCIVGSSGW